MAHIIVETQKEDQERVLEVLKKLQGKTTPVSAIAKQAGLKESTTRYVLIDLIEAGKVEKVATKAFNKHYVRYSYTVKSLV